MTTTTSNLWFGLSVAGFAVNVFAVFALVAAVVLTPWALLAAWPLAIVGLVLTLTERYATPITVTSTVLGAIAAGGSLFLTLSAFVP